MQKIHFDKNNKHVLQCLEFFFRIFMICLSFVLVYVNLFVVIPLDSFLF
jgi:hypothetical protein